MTVHRINGHVQHTDLGNAVSVVHVHQRVDHLDGHDMAGLLLLGASILLWGALVLAGALDASRWVGVALWGGQAFAYTASVVVVVRGYRRRRRARPEGQVTP